MVSSLPSLNPIMEQKTFTKDGIGLQIGNIPIPEKMYFYERFNGSVFNVSEKDASKIHKKFKFLGVSDGIDYVNTIKELQSNYQKLEMKEIRVKMLEAMEKEKEKAKNNLTPPVLRPINLGMKDQVFLPGWKDEIK